MMDPRTDDTRTFLTDDVLADDIREEMKTTGYRMVHLCWPTSGYCYVFQLPDAPKGKCETCSTKYSLAFPTTGTK